MKFEVQIYGEDIFEGGQIETFKNQGLLMAYLQPVIPILSGSVWTLLGDLTDEGKGYLTIMHSELDSEEMETSMALIPAYVNAGIPAIRNAILSNI